MKKISIEQRFWSKVNTASEACWMWLAQVDRDGFGRFQINTKSYRSHRIAHALSYGETDSRLAIEQTCHNKLCMKPDHLVLIPGKPGHSRRFPVKLEDDAFCPKGHPFIARSCKDCKKELDSRFKS